jgi:hypothetical protein
MLGVRLKIGFLRTVLTWKLSILGYPVQWASSNDGTVPLMGILGSIPFPLSANLVACCRPCNMIKGQRVYRNFEEAQKYVLGRRHE